MAGSTRRTGYALVCCVLLSHINAWRIRIDGLAHATQNNVEHHLQNQHANRQETLPPGSGLARLLLLLEEGRACCVECVEAVAAVGAVDTTSSLHERIAAYDEEGEQGVPKNIRNRSSASISLKLLY